jgi:putative transposase
MLAAVEELAQTIPVTAACEAFGFARSTLYRRRREPIPKAQVPRRAEHNRALSANERSQMLDVLHSQRFQDSPPRQVWATLLDEGQHLCSISTMYRLLREQGESQERRDQRTHPAYARPELLATAPNQLWSWDITWLRGPQRLDYFYLYVILDVFSRYVVGWMVAEQESADLAQRLIAESCRTWAIQPGTLTLHADRGAPMTSKPVAQLLEDLRVGKSHSRPYTSNDNPYSEAQFKTMKYRPDYPDRFQDHDQARTWAVPFFDWYNNQHRHSSLGLMTPEMVYFGRATQITQARTQVLQKAYERHPERFVRGHPLPPRLPDAVWINPPRPVEGQIAPLVLPTITASLLDDSASKQNNHHPGMSQKGEDDSTHSSFQESCASNSTRPTSSSDSPSIPMPLDEILVDIDQRLSTLLPPLDAH